MQSRVAVCSDAVAAGDAQGGAGGIRKYTPWVEVCFIFGPQHRRRPTSWF